MCALYVSSIVSSQPGFACRSMQIAADLDSLAKASNITNRSIEVTPTQQAKACCEYMASMRDIAQEETDDNFRQEAALRYVVPFCESNCKGRLYLGQLCA